MNCTLRYTVLCNRLAVAIWWKLYLALSKTPPSPTSTAQSASSAVTAHSNFPISATGRSKWRVTASMNSITALRIRLGVHTLLKDQLDALLSAQILLNLQWPKPFWSQASVPTLTRELSEMLSVFNYNVVGLPNIPWQGPWVRVHIFNFIHPSCHTYLLHSSTISKCSLWQPVLDMCRIAGHPCLCFTLTALIP